MFRRGLSILVALGLGLASQPIAACEYDPFLFQLPGESEAQAQARSAQIYEDFGVKSRLDREKLAFETATTVFLGRVVSKVEVDRGRIGRPATIVHPMAAFKGALPTANRTLIDEMEGGMCSDVGDGRGVGSSIGELVVVFEGLSKTAYRPRGVDSLPVSSVRTIKLLDWLRKQGKDLED